MNAYEKIHRAMNEEMQRMKPGKHWALLFLIDNKLQCYDNTDAVACFQRIIEKYSGAELLDLQAFPSKADTMQYCGNVNHVAKLYEKYGLVVTKAHPTLPEN